MTDLEVNDPVYVERGDSQQLEGVVAYLGKAQFADGDDWVGVILTGTSLGLGKNDGSVQGVSYFSCGAKNGVFVRKSHVSRRPLTRLEELRLKRELAKQSAGISSPMRTTIASTRSPTKFSVSSANSPKKSTASRSPTITSSHTAPATSEVSMTASSSSRTRLEEIRAKRAALAEKQTAPLLPSSSQTLSRPESPSLPSETPAISNDDVEHLEKQLQEMGILKKQNEELTGKLRNKEEENASLQQALSRTEQEVDEAVKARKEAKTEPATIVDRDLEQELQKAHDDLRDMDERLQDVLGELDTRKRELDRERQERALEIEQLILVRSELSALQHEFQARLEQTDSRSASDASHYKERAKLQAELGAAKRQVEELEKEKLEMESVLEDLALDKEQLQEEKEAMQDRLEELKIDAETAQMEVEELKMELELAKEVSEGAASVRSASMGGEGTGADADDVAQALSVQNARLREALIRLREQASLEKIELSRALRAVEKDAAAGTALTEEVETLCAAKKKLEEEMRDLKEMVDQGSAFESMVEDLSNRVLVLEDDNLALKSTIREMEEAADITAEMEEVQADENKSLMRDLEGRDSVIRNLEEAIRMQRRREEDFRRTVGNYRKTVETLKEEKKALMAFQEGDKGEKGNLLATSQKALARAAQLVVDASVARKCEAEAAFDRIEADVQRHLSMRLESLLPVVVASSEVASMKGELLLSRVAGKASRSLEGMASVFTGIIRSSLSKLSAETEDETPLGEDSPFEISDEATLSITNMIHQSEVAFTTINVTSDLLKILSAGQWPDLLSPDASTELGAIVGNSIAELDVVLGDQLRTLKEEGVLSPHNSNIGAFHQTVQTTMQTLKTTMEVDGPNFLPQGWSPPGWQMFKDVSIAKFSCISAGAVVALIVSPDDGTSISTISFPISERIISSVKHLMLKLDQISAEVTKSCHRLVRLDLQRESTISDLTKLAVIWREASLELLEIVKKTFSAKAEFSKKEVTECESVADSTMRVLVQFSSALRAAGLNFDPDGKYHPLSPESKDAWEGVSSLARAMRSVDGDADDVNYLLRARALENQLAEAVESVPKLSNANAKVSTLEKVRMLSLLVFVDASPFFMPIIRPYLIVSLLCRALQLDRRRLQCKTRAYPSSRKFLPRQVH